ncbi:MAG: zf-HC2 domain-containing protein [Deltaproteobacteria bacterium]|nr:zf-HC2 domain-containing protein [Deltaproteobacteria bacterium]
MECAKIKSLLSEYMDKALVNDTAKEVKEHLLSCRDCSSEYFKLKSIAQDMNSMERYRAPSNLLNRVNMAIRKRPRYLRLPDFIPGSGGFRLPMEYVTLAATALLVVFIVTGIYMDKPKDIMIADSGSSKTFSVSNRGTPVELEFIPVSGKASDTVSSDKLFSVSSGKGFNDSQIPDILKIPEMDTPMARHEILLSRLNELIVKSGGDIVLKEHKGAAENIDAITVSIPVKSYNSFIQKAEEIGRFHPAAPALSGKSADQILMRIKFNVGE